MPRKSLHGDMQTNESKRGYGASQSNPGPFRFTKIAQPKHKPKSYQYWSLEDLLAYLSCLLHFKGEFMSSSKPCWKAFKSMSALRPHLNPNQCRIHHKKMLDEYSDIEVILLHFEDTINVHSTAVLSLRKQLREMEAVKIAQEEEIKPSNQREMGVNLIANSFFWPYSSDLKQQKEDNIRTDASYVGEYSEGRSVKLASSICASYGFMMQPQLWLGNSLGGREKQAEWRQCHQLFLAWVNKLHSLMQ